MAPIWTFRSGIRAGWRAQREDLGATQPHVPMARICTCIYRIRTGGEDLWKANVKGLEPCDAEACY